MSDDLVDGCIFAGAKFFASCVWWVAIVAFWLVVYLLSGIVALFWGMGNLAARKPFTAGIVFPYLAFAPWGWRGAWRLAITDLKDRVPHGLSEEPFVAAEGSGESEGQVVAGMAFVAVVEPTVAGQSCSSDEG